MKRDLIYIIALFVFAALYFNACTNNIAIKKSMKENSKVFNDSLEYFKNSIGLITAQKLAHQGSERELKNIISAKSDSLGILKTAIKGFKKIASAAKVETETKIDTVRIPFKVEIPCEFTREFEKKDKYFSIFGNINQSGINFNSITIPNTQAIVLGQKKTGFFKDEFRFEVTNSNPHINVIQADAYSVQYPKKRFGVGIFGGVDLLGNLTFGLGVNYSVIRF